MTYFSYNPPLIKKILFELKFLTQKILFELKLLSQGSIEQDHLSKNVKKFRSEKKINFSNESVKKTTICDVLFIIATFYCLQNVNKQSSEMKINTKIVFLQQAQFFAVWSPFCMQAKNNDLPPSFSENYFW